MARKKNKSIVSALMFVVICVGIIGYTLVSGTGSGEGKENVAVASNKGEAEKEKDNTQTPKNNENKKDEVKEDTKKVNQEETKKDEQKPVEKEEAKEEKKEDNKEEENKEETSKTESVQLNNNTKNDDGKINSTIEKSTAKTETDKKYPNVEKVVYNPFNNVIVIDPGHGYKSNLEKEPNAPGSTKMKIKDGGGATGAFTGVPEYVVAMQVSMKLKAKLEDLGYRVVLTKTKHEEIPGNVARAMVGNREGAALVLRMHADAYEKESANGATMLAPVLTEYTAAIYDESKRCAPFLINSMVAEAGMYNRGVKYRKDITGFNWSKVPVVLVEMGFMSNEKEDRLLVTDEYQEKIATGLAKGIMKALPIKDKEGSEEKEDDDISELEETKDGDEKSE